MLAALRSISTQQAKGTEQTCANTLWFLNYNATHPNDTIRYTDSDMVLHIHSNASYLSKHQSHRRAGGNYFLGDICPDMSKPPTTLPCLNSPIYSIPCIMSNVMGSDAKAKIGAAYINGQEAVPICTLLLKLGHPQPATPIEVDNSTTDGFANDTIKEKRPKAINMGFYWISNCTSQGQFLIY